MMNQVKTAKKLSLKVASRKKNEKPKNKRMIPAILYGPTINNKMLWVDTFDFSKIYNEAGESTIFDIVLKDNKGKEEKHGVLVFDVQYDPIKDIPCHVDFYKVNMKEEITTEVELEFIGEAPAVKELGGVLVRNIDEVEVTCLPADLPSSIEVNISSLKTFDDYIYIKDLVVPEGVRIEADPEMVVAVVSPPRSQEELEKLDEKVEIDIDSVEGMKKEETAKPEEGSKEEK